MWLVSNVAVRLHELQFSESTRALSAVRQLLADGVQVANALEYVDWSKDVVQPEVCGHCGTEGCGGGGYVSIRRAGEYAVWLPAFDRMAEDEWSATEYAPPDYFAERGMPVLSQTQVDAITASAVGFPSFSALRPPTGLELVRAVQWEAPFQILGRWPGSVQLRAEDVLAVSDGERDDVLEEFSVLLGRVARLPAVELRPLDPAEGVVSLFLDDPRYSEWPAFTRVGGGCLLLAPGLVVDAPRQLAS